MPQNPIESLEEAIRSQEQIEQLARLAHAAKLAIEQFEDAFYELTDYPEHLFELLPQLIEAAAVIEEAAVVCLDWAQGSDADFDPSSNKSEAA